MICKLLVLLSAHWSFIALPPQCIVRRPPTLQPRTVVI